MIAFIEESREALGVEPICKALQFAPSTYYDRRAIARDPERASLRAKSDAALSLKIDGAWADNRKLYGARKIVGWRTSTSMKTQFVLPSQQIAWQSPAGQRTRWSRQSGKEKRQITRI